MQIEIIEHDRLNIINTCVNSLATSGLEGVKSAEAIYDRMADICGSADIPKDVSIAAHHLRSLFPVIPQQSYDTPTLYAPLRYLSFGIPIGL